MSGAIPIRAEHRFFGCFGERRRCHQKDRVARESDRRSAPKARCLQTDKTPPSLEKRQKYVSVTQKDQRRAWQWEVVVRARTSSSQRGQLDGERLRQRGCGAICSPGGVCIIWKGSSARIKPSRNNSLSPQTTLSLSMRSAFCT